MAKKKLTVLVTNPDTEKIIREVMRIDGQTKERAGNDLLRLAAKIPPARVGSIEVRPIRDLAGRAARSAR